MRSRARALHIVVILAWLVGGAAPATARPRVKGPASVDAELITLMASKAKAPSHSKAGKPIAAKGVDPRLGKQPALARPPFSAYDTFTLLRRSGAVLAKGISWKTKLASGFELIIGLKDVIIGKKADQPMQFVLTARLAKPGSTVTDPALEVTTVAGEMVFFPTPRYRGGILVVGIKVLAP